MQFTLQNFFSSKFISSLPDYHFSHPSLHDSFGFRLPPITFLMVRRLIKFDMHGRKAMYELDLTLVFSVLFTDFIWNNLIMHQMYPVHKLSRVTSGGLPAGSNISGILAILSSCPDSVETIALSSHISASPYSYRTYVDDIYLPTSGEEMAE